MRNVRARARDLLDALGWIEVPAGVVQRGTPTDDIDAVFARHSDLGIPRSYFVKEAPRAPVRVGAFVMLRVPVTIKVWNLFAQDTGRPVVEGGTRHPIDERSWHDAVAFCEWYSSYADEPVRLPTEDEWERAARGDDAREYPWGDTFDRACANLAEAGLNTTSPVGAFPNGASPFGFLDLAGNADEWTSTLYAPYPGAPDDVPLTESWALDPHITRGGSWRHDRDLARCARRHGLYPNENGEIGAALRLVRRSRS